MRSILVFHRHNPEKLIQLLLFNISKRCDQFPFPVQNDRIAAVIAKCFCDHISECIFLHHKNSRAIRIYFPVRDRQHISDKSLWAVHCNRLSAPEKRLVHCFNRFVEVHGLPCFISKNFIRICASIIGAVGRIQLLPSAVIQEHIMNQMVSAAVIAKLENRVHFADCTFSCCIRRKIRIGSDMISDIIELVHFDINRIPYLSEEIQVPAYNFLSQ
ncbi:hypothetical protein D3C73_492980 [compost metagenome]